jgi:hypothetical protein
MVGYGQLLRAAAAVGLTIRTAVQHEAGAAALGLGGAAPSTIIILAIYLNKIK